MSSIHLKWQKVNRCLQYHPLSLHDPQFVGLKISCQLIFGYFPIKRSRLPLQTFQVDSMNNIHIPYSSYDMNCSHGESSSIACANWSQIELGIVIILELAIISVKCLQNMHSNVLLFQSLQVLCKLCVFGVSTSCLSLP